jgi:mono/diheme cytochrome c family protein
MKSIAWPWAIVAPCVLLATVWARGGSSGDDGRAGPAVAAQPPATMQGLTSDQRKDLFHLSEGIELVPLAWIKALKSIKTNRPFLEFPERFGLLPDPENKDQLPIGITASPSRGAEFLGPMVGVNCAACHVGAVTFRGQDVPLLGAPNLFDLNAFYNELFHSVGVTIADPGSRERFLADLAKRGDVGTAILVQQLGAAAVGAGHLGGNELKAIARFFQTRLLEVVKTVVQEAEAQLGGRPPDDAARAALQKAVSTQVGRLFEKDALGLVALVLSPDDPDDPVKAALKAQPDPILTGVLRGLAVELSLLRARIQFLARLKALHDAQRPLPGPGRIDAFNGIRDLVFPTSDAIPADSPVSYPALWMVNQTFWLHWDGNTNSVIERNIGQALGQGAPFEPVGQGNYHSKVQPANIHNLEWIVRDLTPPDWPAPLFGAIDQAKAARGRAIYQARCERCHAVVPRGGHDIYDILKAAQAWAQDPKGDPPAIPKKRNEQLISVDQVGTDPARAMNFATSVGRQKPLYSGGTDFAVGLGQAARRYSEQSYADNAIAPLEQLNYDWPRQIVRWQTTRCYVARPLVSVWATAPYLHNASVPTIYHLLLPAKDRPKLFPVGQREYDPVKLGYVIDPKDIPAQQIPLLFEINATASGNLNVGHEGPDYGTDLEDDQRYDLLEYLKTL